MTEEKGGWPRHGKHPEPQRQTHQFKDRNESMSEQEKFHFEKTESTTQQTQKPKTAIAHGCAIQMEYKAPQRHKNSIAMMFRK